MRRLFVPLCLLALIGCSPVHAGDDDGAADASIRPDSMMCMNDLDCTGAASHCLDGLCVQCLGNDQCAAGQLCDTQTHECRGCAQHSECASNVCDPVLATCAVTDEVVYVDSANGSFAGNCGTHDLPCSSLDTGLGKVNADRHYLSLFGTFNFPKISLAQRITIVGYGSATLDTGFDPQMAGALIDVKAGADVVLDGLKIINNQGGEGITCANAKLWIGHSVISKHMGNGISASKCSLDIEDTEISGNSQMALYSDQLTMHSSLIDGNVQGGINACSDGLDVRNNVFVNNTTGFNRYQGAMEFFCGTGLMPGLVAYNTLVNNSINGLERGLIGCSSQPNLTIDSNIIFGNHVDSGPTVTNCVGLGKNVSDQNLNTQTIVTTDPKFVDAANFDFHLQPGSPARNLGTPGHALPYDFDGKARSDGQPDMGAFEVP